jgi:hypothetical protein
MLVLVGGMAEEEGLLLLLARKCKALWHGMWGREGVQNHGSEIVVMV